MMDGARQEHVQGTINRRRQSEQMGNTEQKCHLSSSYLAKKGKQIVADIKPFSWTQPQERAFTPGDKVTTIAFF